MNSDTRPKSPAEVNYDNRIAALNSAREAFLPLHARLKETRDQLGSIEAKREAELASAAAFKAEWTKMILEGADPSDEAVREKLREQRYCEELADEFSEMIAHAKVRESQELDGIHGPARSLESARTAAIGAYSDLELDRALSEVEGSALVHALAVATAATRALRQEADMHRMTPLLREDVLHRITEAVKDAAVKAARAALLPPELAPFDLALLGSRGPLTPASHHFQRMRARQGAAAAPADHP